MVILGFGLLSLPTVADSGNNCTACENGSNCTACENITIDNITVVETYGTSPLTVDLIGHMYGVATNGEFDILNTTDGTLVGGACRIPCLQYDNNTSECDYNLKIVNLGTYNVSFTTFGPDGCCINRMSDQQITVTPQINLIPTFSYVSVGRTIMFIDTSNVNDAVYQ